MEKNIDILCIGEIIIDFIGNNKNKSILATKKFSKILGGSPLNVAINTSNIGINSAIVATIGNDDLGLFATQKLQETKVNLLGLNKNDAYSTSIILVSKSDNTPQFIPYRSADFQINPHQITPEMILSSRILHTTCFALSKNPARETILNAAKFAFQNNIKLSIDLNFSAKIWDNPSDHITVINSLLRYNPLIKISEDDSFRIFNKHLKDTEIFDYFHQSGAEIVCLTKGASGVCLSDNYKIITQKAPALPNIVDATGAGDAFWSGFLTGFIKNKNWEDCIAIGQKIASIKLQTIGHIMPDSATFLG